MEENCNTFLIFFLKGLGEEIVDSLDVGFRII